MGCFGGSNKVERLDAKDQKAVEDNNNNSKNNDGSGSGGKFTDADLAHDKFMKMLNEDDALAALSRFLQKSYTEQHLMFVLEVRKYRRMSPAEQRKAAQRLYDVYVKPGERYQINISAELALAVKASVAAPTAVMFDPAERICLDLIQGNFFHVFLDAPEYLAVLEARKKGGGKKSRKGEEGGCCVIS